MYSNCYIRRNHPGGIMDIDELKKIEQGIIFLENLIKHMPKNYPQVIKLQLELDKIKEKHRIENEMKNSVDVL